MNHSVKCLDLILIVLGADPSHRIAELSEGVHPLGLKKLMVVLCVETLIRTIFWTFLHIPSILLLWLAEVGFLFVMVCLFGVIE